MMANLLSLQAVPLRTCPAPALLLLLVLCVVCSVTQTVATPQQYVSNIAREDCTRHPERAYGRHGSPVPDRRATISLTPLPASSPPAVTASQATPAPSSAAVTELCAGSNYTLTVAWTAGSLDATPSLANAVGLSLVNALVTTGSGTLEPERRTGLAAITEASEALGVLNLYSKECPNRYVTPVVTSKINLLLGVPQDQAGPITIKVTSAAGAFDEYKSFTATIPVEKCSTSSRANALGTSNSTTTDTAVPVQQPAKINTTVAAPATVAEPATVPVAAADGPSTVGQPIPVSSAESTLVQQINAANGNRVINLSNSSTNNASLVTGVGASNAAVNSARSLVAGRLLMVCGMMVMTCIGQRFSLLCV